MNRLTAIIIIVLLLFGVFYFANKWMESKGNLERVQSNVTALKSETEVWKNKAGQWESKALGAEGTISVLERSHQHELDQIEQDHNIKVRNLRSAITAMSSTNIPISVLPEVVNEGSEDCDCSGQIISFSDQTKWYNVSGQISTSNASLSIQAYDSISYITTWRREGWLKPKKLYVEAISYSPYTKVTGLKSIDVTDDKASRFGLGPVVGVGISSDFKFVPIVGVGLQYTLIRF